jgi:hypothetical protein
MIIEEDVIHERAIRICTDECTNSKVATGTRISRYAGEYEDDSVKAKQCTTTGYSYRKLKRHATAMFKN